MSDEELMTMLNSFAEQLHGRGRNADFAAGVIVTLAGALITGDFIKVIGVNVPLAEVIMRRLKG